ncbi:MAG: GNAT family N-acetyltransferase [Pseudomonadota bacterium]
MSPIDYLNFKDVDLNRLMQVVNEDSLRTHLIDHPYFDAATLQSWVDEKRETDAVPGCRVRVVSIDGTVAGWCGIQPDDDGFEIAIVIAQPFWGSGIAIFRTLMQWAKELGHSEVLFHLLDSRREYKALSKMATKVRRTELLGRSFTTYYFPVN